MTGVAPAGGSSVHFALGSPDNDRDLELARAWANSIVQAVGDPSVAMSDALSASALALRLVPGRVQPVPTPGVPAPAPLVLTPKGIEATHRIPGHSLILVAPREPDTMFLRGISGIDTAARLGVKQLEPFVVANASVSQKPADPAPSRSDLFALWLLLVVLNRGFQSIYLCGTESSGDLAQLAKRLHDLTRAHVYWNDDPVHFDFTTIPVTEKPPNGRLTRTLTRAFVGPSRSSVADGKPFVGTGKVPLQAKPGEFLPGAQHEIPS